MLGLLKQRHLRLICALLVVQIGFELCVVKTTILEVLGLNVRHLNSLLLKPFESNGHLLAQTLVEFVGLILEIGCLFPHYLVVEIDVGLEDLSQLIYTCIESAHLFDELLGAGCLFEPSTLRLETRDQT